VVVGVEQVGGLVADLYLVGYLRVDQHHPILCSGPPKPKFKQTFSNTVHGHAEIHACAH
jgi:hypothetical protein